MIAQFEQEIWDMGLLYIYCHE